MKLKWQGKPGSNAGDRGKHMRLVCPSCGAQYEVDDRVMPENGRDVQCSNCGHGWFQLPPSAEAGTTQSPFDNIDDLDDEVMADTDEMSADASAQPSAEDAAVSDGPVAGTPARQLDDGVRSILQEEAERELKARESEREGLETQPDLGLDDAPASTADNISKTMADEQAAIEDETAPTSDDIKARNVLPDIEEINSTLDAPADETGDVVIDPADGAEVAAGGFRRGFILVVVLACLLAILYIFAPTIGERFPAVQPAMEQFVAFADKVRIGLEDIMRAAIGKMQGLIDKPETN
ncbi:zinc-ribbon domain-containing protein [Aliiroseovarius sp. Z3]|nr:zinc-ribbon domain-containing protein [Aliiroseovarius sp. Z3]